MVTSVLAQDNRPEAVSSAHWGDVSITSSEVTLLKAALKLLAIKVTAQAIQEIPLSSITLTSTAWALNEQRPNVTNHLAKRWEYR